MVNFVRRLAFSTYLISTHRSLATLDPTTGGTDDYAHIRANIPYAYTLELRGPGFDPDRSNIRPSIEEVWNGMKAMINAIENKP